MAGSGPQVRGSREPGKSGARASPPATTRHVKVWRAGLLGFFVFDMINMINMIWRASVPTSRLPLCGRMVSGFSAEHREGRASARPRASRRLPLPAAAVTPHPSKPLRLCVSALKNSQRSTFNSQRSAGGDGSRSRLRIRKPCAKLRIPLLLADYD